MWMTKMLESVIEDSRKLCYTSSFGEMDVATVPSEGCGSPLRDFTLKHSTRIVTTRSSLLSGLDIGDFGLNFQADSLVSPSLQETTLR